MALSDYELILLLDPTVGAEDRDALANNAKGRIENGGELTNETPWGLRKMAFEIDKHGEADYRYYRFRGEKSLLDELDHNLKITDGVLRFRIFKVDPESPVIIPPDTEQIMKRDESDERGRGRGRGDRGPRRGRDDYESEDGGDSGDGSGHSADVDAAV